MAAGEFMVTCPDCGESTRLPFAARQRDSLFCSRCGKPVPLRNAEMPVGEAGVTRSRSQRRPRRPGKRR